MGTIRVATTQLRGEGLETFEQFVQYVETILQNDANIDLFVLPEYALLPLFKHVTDITRPEVRAFYDAAFTPLRQSVEEAFQQLANTYHTHIVVGSHWYVEEEKAYNSALFFKPNTLVQYFPKCYPTPPEVAMDMTPGTASGLVTLTNGIQVGILICYESEFPELARELSLKGADILVVPSLTLNERGAARVEICARARAVENQVYVVCSTNQAQLTVPIEKPICSVGRAGIYGPIDNKSRLVDGIVAKADGDGDVVLIEDLDLSILDDSRHRSEAPLRKNIKRVMQFETL